MAKVSYAATMIFGVLLGLFFMFMVMVYPSERDIMLEEEGTTLVKIQGRDFVPNTLTIMVGDTVKWTNRDTAKHKISGGKFASDVLYPSSSFSHTFTETGTYEYSCAFYPSMKGTIIVK